MKLAGILSLLVGLLLGGIALNSAKEDADGAAQRIHQGFEDLHAGDQAALDRGSHEADERASAEDHEWVGCAVFLVAGIALVSAGARKSEPEESQPSGLGLRG